jgi:hypothetical protein
MIVLTLTVLAAACAHEHKHTSNAPTITMGTTTTAPTRDKATIQSTIAGARTQVQYCYEKELKDKPDLEGTVTVDFVIDASGAVTESKASGLNDDAVETCIAGVVKGLAFGEVKGGGMTNVRYPFTLKKTGS